jgi:hypothetical protein
MEKAQHQSENPADVKASEKMAKLYDEIKKDNPTKTEAEVHSLNVFLSRLLFCFFAEDTGIFEKGQFTNAIDSHTQPDGSDLNSYLDSLFDVLNTEPNSRRGLPAYLDAFPYVNGGLFRDSISAPTFSRKSRQALIDNGELDWSAINPDIFGSMIQAVVTPEHRGGLGMHYTSVPNIMKVIEPLFLNDLNEEFENGKNEPRKLNALLDRLSRIKVFDPAAGSGNFLIISYKELRLLEIKILQQLILLQRAASGFEPHQLELIPKAQLTLAASYQPSMFSRIELSQFYGIELDDFAHEIAILSLWLAQHQMNQKFKEVFGSANPTLPLQAGGNIVHGNATRLNWDNICSVSENEEVFVLGNPPYLDSRNQDEEQKADMKQTFGTDYKSLDYIACWFLKASEFIRGKNGQFAFVSTNSICQGEQVALIWPKVLNEDLEIGFAHRSFKWTNNAKDKAAVIVIIVGVRNISSKPKVIYTENHFQVVKNINPYLSAGFSSYITRRSKPLNPQLPKIVYGNLINDDGNLVLNESERNDLLKSHPELSKFIKQYIGAKEYLRGEIRYCLFIEDYDLEDASKNPEILKRLNAVVKHREESSEKSTQLLAKHPNRFYFQSYNHTNSIIIPRTSSENREYIPIGFLNSDVIISDAAQAIYGAEPWVFGIISSRMHMTWVRAVAGRLKSDYRYSSAICYNTFPCPLINSKQIEEIELCVYRILHERETHSEKTLSELYDPKKMPSLLKAAHEQLDFIVDSVFRVRPFVNDDERLDFLFELYDRMIKDEKSNQGEIIFDESNPKKKRTKKHA